MGRLVDEDGTPLIYETDHDGADTFATVDAVVKTYVEQQAKLNGRMRELEAALRDIVAYARDPEHANARETIERRANAALNK